MDFNIRSALRWNLRETTGPHAMVTISRAPTTLLGISSRTPQAPFLARVCQGFRRDRLPIAEIDKGQQYAFFHSADCRLGGHLSRGLHRASWSGPRMSPVRSIVWLGLRASNLLGSFAVETKVYARTPPGWRTKTS